MKPPGMTFWQSELEPPEVQKDCASDSEVDTSSSTELVEAHIKTRRERTARPREQEGKIFFAVDKHRR